MYGSLKQQEVSRFEIGENTFYVKKFPAFYAANLSGELTKLVAPVVGALAPLMGSANESFDIRNVQVDDAVPAISKAFGMLSGEEVERIMKKLFIVRENVSVEGPCTDGKTVKLNESLANEIFCGEVQEMYVLCWHVINLNFQGFFKNIEARFGLRTEVSEAKETSSDTASLT